MTIKLSNIQSHMRQDVSPTFKGHIYLFDLGGKKKNYFIINRGNSFSMSHPHCTGQDSQQDRFPPQISQLLCCLVAKSCQILLWIHGVAHQAPLSMRFPRQEDWLRLPFSSLQISHIQEIPFMSEQNRNHCKLYQTPALWDFNGTKLNPRVLWTAS